MFFEEIIPRFHVLIKKYLKYLKNPRYIWASGQRQLLTSLLFIYLTIGVWNIAQYSAANVPFPVVFFFLFLPTFPSSMLSAMFTWRCDPSEKISLALMSRAYVRVSVKPAYIKQTTIREEECEGGMTGLAELPPYLYRISKLRNLPKQNIPCSHLTVREL